MSQRQEIIESLIAVHKKIVDNLEDLCYNSNDRELWHKYASLNLKEYQLKQQLNFSRK